MHYPHNPQRMGPGKRFAWGAEKSLVNLTKLVCPSRWRRGDYGDPSVLLGYCGTIVAPHPLYMFRERHFAPARQHGRKCRSDST